MSEWKDLTLQEADVILIDCVHKTPKPQEKGIPYIGIPQLSEGHIDFEANPRLISEEDFFEWTKKAYPSHNDVVLSRRTNPGVTAHVPKDKKFALGQNLVIIRSTGKTVYKPYLRWLLRGPEWWEQIDKFRNVGAVFDSLRCGDIPNFRLKIPPLPEQKAIAHILGTLDDKIELSRQMNQTLEAMAQALFKSWFVDFDPVMDNALAAGNEISDELLVMAEKRQLVNDSKKLISTNPDLAAKFPSSFVFNETLGKWIPEGWEVKSLSKIIKLIGGGTPKTSVEEYWNGNIPWFSVVDAPNDSDVFVIDTEKKVSDEGVKNSSTQILREGTTIISARGTVGKCAIVGVPMAMNQSCYGIQSVNSNEDIFTYLLVRKNVSDLQNKSHGSVFSTITRDTFNAIYVVVPPNRKVINVFESSLKYNFEKMKSNLFENQILTQLRDRLLPELISGKVRVKEGIFNKK